MPNRPIRGVLGHLRRVALVGDDAERTDGQLLGEIVLRRDEEAFARLVQRHGPMVLGVCQRLLRHRQDAEDAFQATFLVLARKAASVQPPEHLGGWLYGVAYRTALEARRLAARRRARERQVENMPHPTTEPEELWHDLRPALDQELSRLPDKHRLPIVLCDLEGRTRQEVARQLGLPEGTLSNRLAAGRQALARRLTRRGLALSCGAVGAALSRGGVSAAVPATLVAATVDAAFGATVISGEVVALTKGVLGSMFLTNLKLTTAALLLLCLLGAGVGTALLGLSTAAEAPPDDPGEPLAKPLLAIPGAGKTTVVERGSVRAALVSDVSCSVPATIRWIQEDGAIVKKGDQLAVLDDTALREQAGEQRVAFDQAVAARALAESSLTRIRKENQLDVRAAQVDVKLAKLVLAKNDGKDSTEREILALKMEQAEIKLERIRLRGQDKDDRAVADLISKVATLRRETDRKRDLEARLAGCLLRAPHDGVAVHYVPETPRPGLRAPVVAVGEPVREGQKLIQVHGMDRFLVVADVHEAQVSGVRVGQPVSICIDAFPNRVLTGKIKSVATKASPKKWRNADVKVYPVEVELTDHPRGLKPGMSAEVSIDTDRGAKK